MMAEVVCNGLPKLVSPEDLACTIFDALGIDTRSYIEDKQGKPVALMHSGRPLRKLFA